MNLTKQLRKALALMLLPLLAIVCTGAGAAEPPVNPVMESYGCSYNPGMGEKDLMAARLRFLDSVGLGYLALDRGADTLSGGEAQRIKLASFLGKGNQQTPTLFIFDEPTTGLHFYDIEKLLIAFNALLDKGHSLVVIEHNMEVIKCADHLIDLGPDGGENGGYLLFAGHPKEFIKLKDNTTAQFLSEKLVEI